MIRLPKPGEHAFIAGQTGSGKSVMLQHLIRQSTTSPVFIMDSKGDDGFLDLALPAETLVIFDAGIKAFYNYVRQPKRKIADYVVIRPPLGELGEVEILDYYLLLIYTYFRGHAIIAVDELYMIHKSGRCGKGLNALLTRGRSKGMSLYGATQRPAWISGFCMSEATHYLIFRLIDVKDRARLTHVGYPKDKVLDRYHYFDYDSMTGEQGYFDPLPFDEVVNDDKPQPNGWI